MRNKKGVLEGQQRVGIKNIRNRCQNQNQDLEKVVEIKRRGGK